MKIITCPLHGAKFDSTTGKDVGGMKLGMTPEFVQKLPTEVVVMMFQRTSEIVSDIEIRPLKTYKVKLEGDSIYLDRGDLV